MLRKVRFFSSVGTIYILTIGTIGALLYSSHLFGAPVWATPRPIAVNKAPAKLPPEVIKGKPVRIVISSAGIDLPIDEGYYEAGTGAWTLSDTRAQFAVMTSLANDHSGTTFIYGHGTDAVFGKIGTNPPPVGTIAELHTDSGRIFTYSLQVVKNHDPSDTSLFDDTSSGSPRLVIQTCTGIFSEWRTMFTFTFERVT